MRAEKPGQTIQPTELVHEAYVRLAGHEHIEWQGRSQFLAVAATQMRRIRVDRARKKTAGKHGGGAEKVQLVDALAFSREKSKDIVALDEALKGLELPCRRAKAVLWSCASSAGWKWMKSLNLRVYLSEG